MWTPWEARLHTHILELRAVCLACKVFLAVIHSLHIQLMSDHPGLHEQGEVRSLLLCLEAVRLWNWCIRHKVTLQVAYLLGIHSFLADDLSSHFSADHTSEIHNSILTDIFTRWGTLLWDLFASQMNKNLPHIVPGKPQAATPKATLYYHECSFKYAFPPIPCFHRS